MIAPVESILAAPKRNLAVSWNFGAEAREPYRFVHRIATSFLDEDSLVNLASKAYSEAVVHEPGDVNIGHAWEDEMLKAAPNVDMIFELSQALMRTGVMGSEALYRKALSSEISYMASMAASFHNDTEGHWPGCLFWVLALDVTEADFVMPHAEVRLALSPGDLVVFDPAMAHGLCRRGESKVDREALLGGERFQQSFLSGELSLSKQAWAALGCPWKPLGEFAGSDYLDVREVKLCPKTGRIMNSKAIRIQPTKAIPN